MTPLDQALDALPRGEGSVVLPVPGGVATLDVLQADRLGVRLRSLRVTGTEVAAAHEIERLANRRGLPELRPTEIEPRLGGGSLRSVVDEEGFFEATVRPDATEIGRFRVTPEGREPTDWTLTRRDLNRWVDALQRPAPTPPSRPGS